MGRKRECRNVEVTAVCFTPKILKLGRQRAKALKRSFSNYVETLVEKDVLEKQPA